MTPEIEVARRKVARHILEQLESVSTRGKQEIISKLIDKLPDEYVIALEFVYGLYKTEKGTNQHEQ